MIRRRVAKCGTLCQLVARRATLGAFSFAPRYVGGSLAKGRWPGALGRLTDVAASVELFWAVRAALGSSWTRGSFVILFCSVCLTGARCETLRRFGNCGVCWVTLLVWPLYFFRSLGGGALRNSGTMVACTVGTSKGERRGRRNVSAGQLRRGF